MVSVDVKHHVYLLTYGFQSPGEIKRREVSWTLTKKLAQKRSSAGRWCWARERESWTSSASVVSRRRSYGHCLCDSVQLGQQLRGAVVAAQCRTDTALTSCLFWRRSTAALVFRVGACFEVSLFCPPFPARPRP